MASVRSASLNGIWEWSLSGVQGRAAGGGSWGAEAESFLSVFIQKGGQKLRI